MSSTKWLPGTSDENNFQLKPPNHAMRGAHNNFHSKSNGFCETSWVHIHHDCIKHVTGFPFAPCGPPSPGGSVLNLKNWSRKTKSYYNPIRRQIKRHAMPNPFALHRVSGNDASCGRTFVWLHRFILFTPAVGSLPRVLVVTYVFHVFNILIHDFIDFRSYTHVHF